MVQHSTPDGGKTIFVSHLCTRVHNLLVYIYIYENFIDFVSSPLLYPSIQTLDFAFKKKKKVFQRCLYVCMCCNGTVRLQFHRIFVEYLFVRFFISRLHFACPSCVPKIFTRSSLLSIKSIKYIGKKGRAKIKFRKIKRFVTKRNLSVCKIYDMILNRVTGKIVHLSHQLCNSFFTIFIFRFTIVLRLLEIN